MESGESGVDGGRAMAGVNEPRPCNLTTYMRLLSPQLRGGTLRTRVGIRPSTQLSEEHRWWRREGAQSSAICHSRSCLRKHLPEIFARTGPSSRRRDLIVVAPKRNG